MATYTITVDEMKDHAAELVRAVHEQQIEYVIMQGGAPVALLSPGKIAAPRPETRHGSFGPKEPLQLNEQDSRKRA